MNLSSNGRPCNLTLGTSIGLLNHHVKKGSKISGDDDGPGPEPIPLNSKLWCFFLFPLIIFIMSFNIDVGVAINDYHRNLRGEGGGVFTTVM